jgi:hypothetical protein
MLGDDSCTRDKLEMTLPTQENIEVAIKIYDEIPSWKQADRVIVSYFGQHPSNSEESTVVIKVVLVNSLYITNIWKPLLMADHILNLQNLDEQLQAGNIYAVDRIANLATIGRKFISFASKYAHFSNMVAYPMYDKYVRISMGRFLKRNNYTVGAYERFFNDIESICGRARLACVSWDELDKYLWLYGQKVALDKGENKINRDIAKLYGTADGPALFKYLEPLDVLIDPAS